VFQPPNLFSYCSLHPTFGPQRYIVPCLTYCLLGIIDGQMSPDGALKTIVPIVDVAMIKQFCNLYQARPAHDILFLGSIFGDASSPFSFIPILMFESQPLIILSSSFIYLYFISTRRWCPPTTAANRWTTPRRPSPYSSFASFGRLAAHWCRRRARNSTRSSNS
jgi:hypothetical protein